MVNITEKIEDFLKNEQNIKALANDKEFIGKVSAGTATVETYSEEFKKLGLILSENEVEEVSQTTTKFLRAPVEKLADVSLENVSAGGRRASAAAFYSGLGVTLASGVSAVGFCIAAIYYNSKSIEAKQKGDIAKSEKYSKVSKNLETALCASAVPGIAGVITAAGGIMGVMASS